MEKMIEKKTSKQARAQSSFLLPLPPCCATAVSAAGVQAWDAGPEQDSAQGVWEGRSGKGEKKGAGMAALQLQAWRGCPTPREAAMGCTAHHLATAACSAQRLRREGFGSELAAGAIEMEYKTNKTTFHF